MNDVYGQRAALSVALAWMTIKAGGVAGRGFDQEIANRGMEEGWGHVLYIETPEGDQISYHFNPADASMLEGLPDYQGEWDGSFSGREDWWLKQYRPAPVECGNESAEETAMRRLSPVALRRWNIEKAKLQADSDVDEAASEAILMGYARRWI